MALLIVKSGNQAGARFPLTGARQTIGRGPDCAVRIEDRSISRNHATIFRTPEGKWIIEDSGSTYGTFVNGGRIKTAEVPPGAVVKLGNVALEFQSEPARPAQTPPDPLGAGPKPPLPPRPAPGPLAAPPRLAASPAPIPPKSAGDKPDDSLREAFARHFAGKAEEKRKREHAALEIMSAYEEKKKKEGGKTLVRSSSKIVWIVLAGVVLALGGILVYGFSRPIDMSKVKVSDETMNSVVDYMQKKGMKGGKGKKNVGIQGIGGEHAMDVGSRSGAGSAGPGGSPSSGTQSSDAPLGGDNQPKSGKLNINESAANNSSAPASESKPAEKKQEPDSQGGSVSVKGGEKDGEGKSELHVKSDGSQGAGAGEMDKKIADAERDAGKRTEKDEDPLDRRKKDVKHLLAVTSDDAGSAKTVRMVEEDYIYDDGEPESSISAPAPSGIVAIEIKPSVYPAYLTEVSFFVDFDPWNNRFQIVVVEDNEDAGPLTSKIVYESPPMTAFAQRGWFAFNIAGDGFNKALKSGRWIVGVRSLAPDGPYVGRDDSTAHPHGFTYSPEGDNWSELGHAGIPMIRAVGSYADWK